MWGKLKENWKHLPKNRVISALLVICITGGISLYAYSNRDYISQTITLSSSRSYYQNLRDNLSEAAEEKDPYDIQINFDELWKVNSDVYAWIKIPGTNVDYPILQSATEADEYYLNRTIEKIPQLPGSIYTEKYNAVDFSDPITIIYGHTLIDGSMFSELKKYRDKDFFDSNPYYYIYLPDGRLKYQIFAAVAFDDRYLLEVYDIYNPQEIERYVSELKSSMDGNINPDAAVSGSDLIVTLSTCIDEFPNQRWLVNAVLVEDTRQ